MREADDQEIAELAALADGSLAPARRAALEAEVAVSPELADRLAEQRLAVAYVRSAAEQVEAEVTLDRNRNRRVVLICHVPASSDRFAVRSPDPPAPLHVI